MLVSAPTGAPRSLGCAVVSLPHRVKHVFVLPACDASTIAGRALQCGVNPSSMPMQRQIARCPDGDPHSPLDSPVPKLYIPDVAP